MKRREFLKIFGGGAIFGADVILAVEWVAPHYKKGTPVTSNNSTPEHPIPKFTSCNGGYIVPKDVADKMTAHIKTVKINPRLR